MLIVRNTIVAMHVLLLLESCIVVPTHFADEKPFREDELEAIVVGQSPRTLAVEQLGQPAHSFADGRWITFHDDRKLTEWFVFVGTQAGVSGGTLGGKIDEYTLILEIDESDVIAELAVVHEDHPCNENRRVCYRDGLLKVDFDAEVTIPIPTGHCLVGLYSHRPLSYELPFNFEFNPGSGPKRYIGDDYYWRFELPAGRYEARVMGMFVGEEFFETLEFECQPEERRYLRVLHEKPGEASLAFVPGSTGAADLSTRRCILRSQEVKK